MSSLKVRFYFLKVKINFKFNFKSKTFLKFVYCNFMKMRFSKTFFPFAFLLIFTACNRQVYQIAKSETYANTSINENLTDDKEMEKMILPYKQKLDGEMNRVISYTPVDLSKVGFNSALANLNCDMVLEEAGLIYEKEHHQKIDMCLLNHGGIRRTFTKGDLTVKNVFELMPFENEVVVVTLSGGKMLEMFRFLSAADVGHPVSGIRFVSNDENSILVNGQKFDRSRTYTVVTNDFLLKGGDQMRFFENPLKTEYLGIRQRDLMMGYFEKHDTIQVNLDKRILDK